MGDSKSSSVVTERTENSEGEGDSKKKKVKGDDASSEERSQKPNGVDHKIDIKESVRSFSTKGAAAKPVEQIPKSTMEEERRKTDINVLQAVIQPSEDKTAHESVPPVLESLRPAITSSSFHLPQPKRKSEKMREELLRQDQENQALANLVLHLVKKKRQEKVAQEQIALSESEIFRRSTNMSLLEQAGIISVLEETVAKLNILGYTNHKPVVKQEIKYISILDKLAEKEDSQLIELIKSNKTPQQFEDEKQFIKLQKDRGFLEEALSLTLLEMKQGKTFKILQDIVHLEQEMIKEEADLRFIAKNRQQEVNHCKALLENELRKGKKKLDNRTALLAMLKDEIQEMQYYNGLRFKYTDHWERSRAEQNLMTVKNSEADLYRQLSDFEEMASIEKRCTAEMRELMEQSIQNLGDQVEEWMHRYETEMEERELKITKLKEELEEHHKKLMETIGVFNERERKMNEWKAHKEKQRLEAEYELYTIRMATRIQAWWRGTMVRNHLGPYRKKKKGRKGKKKA